MVFLRTLLLKGENPYTTLHLLGHSCDPSHRREIARTHRKMHEFVLEVHGIFQHLAFFFQDADIEMKMIL
jgi:hypothetical protein